MDISDITAADLEVDITGIIILKKYREQVTKGTKDDKYMITLAGYTRSVFQDFENFLRTKFHLIEVCIKLHLDEYISSSITYKLQPGIYIFSDITKALFNIFQSEYPGSLDVIDIKIDDITSKTKLVVRAGIRAIRFSERSFSSSILGFTPGWDYKHYNEYISQAFFNLNSTNKILLKCDVIDGSVVNGLRQPILYSFLLDKLVRYKVFSQPETVHYKKINKIILNTITFYLEDVINGEIDFNGETLTFKLQMIKVCYNIRVFLNLKLIVIVLVVDIDLLQ